jgi:F0F1-type ATP synthase epsilon subunit
MESIMPRIEKILSTDDGVVALKQQELAIRAKENEDDKMIAEERIKLDKAKLKQKDQSEEEKLKSQEDIAAMKVAADREKKK